MSTWLCRDKALSLHRPLICGILNATPDSFYAPSRGGAELGAELAAQGADLLDVGGMSTRPGHSPVSPEEELARLLPVLTSLRQRLPYLPLSVDSYRPEVLQRALEAGAEIINDISGLADPRIAELAARYGAGLVLTYPHAGNAFAVAEGLQALAAQALSAGVRRECLVLDPGIGFGKTAEENLHCLAHTHLLSQLGYPLMLAVSRKRVVYQTVSATADTCHAANLAAQLFGACQGACILRVHDVASVHQALTLLQSLQEARRHD